METTILISVIVEGLHNFPNANIIFPESGYLCKTHRHLFYITLELAVSHDNRDREFIVCKHDVVDYLHKKYYNERYRMCEFGAMSCEMIAKELLIEFNCKSVVVLEDNESGAKVSN